jgi:hypothetical protein
VSRDWIMGACVQCGRPVSTGICIGCSAGEVNRISWSEAADPNYWGDPAYLAPRDMREATSRGIDALAWLLMARALQRPLPFEIVFA